MNLVRVFTVSDHCASFAFEQILCGSNNAKCTYRDPRSERTDCKFVHRGRIFEDSGKFIVPWRFLSANWKYRLSTQTAERAFKRHYTSAAMLCSSNMQIGSLSLAIEWIGVSVIGIQRYMYMLCFSTVVFLPLRNFLLQVAERTDKTRRNVHLIVSIRGYLKYLLVLMRDKWNSAASVDWCIYDIHKVNYNCNKMLRKL